MNLFKTPIYEQETVIQISRDTHIAHIDTNDKTMIKKLDKKYTRADTKTINGQINRAIYEVPKNCIIFGSIREKTKKRISPENLAALQAGLKKHREGNL